MAKISNQLFLNKYRSSHPEVFLGKGVLKICIKFTREHPCRSAISIKLRRNFIEIALWHGCSPVKLLHISRTPSSKNPFGWLLLYVATVEIYLFNITPEKMHGCKFLKIALHERIDIIAHQFKEWTGASSALKKYILMFQKNKNDVSNRSSQQLLFPKTTELRKKMQAITTLKEQLFGESSCSESHPCKCRCLQLLF